MSLNNINSHPQSGVTKEKGDSSSNISVRPKTNSQQTLMDGSLPQNSNVPLNVYKGSNTSHLTLPTPHGSMSQTQMMNNPYIHKNSGSSFSSTGHMNSLPHNYPLTIMPNDSPNNQMFYSPNPLIPMNINQYNQPVHFNNPFKQYHDNDPQLYNSNLNIPLMQRNLANEMPNSGFKPEFSPFLKYNFDVQQQSPNSLLFSSNFNFGVPKIATGTINNKKPDTNPPSRSSLNPSTRYYAEMLSNNNIDPLTSGTVVFPDKHKNDTFQPKEKKPMIDILDDRKIIKHRPLCSLCGKTFSRASSLKTHIFTVHERIKKYQCPYKECSKRFTTNSNMRRHVRIHERYDSK